MCSRPVAVLLSLLVCAGSAHLALADSPDHAHEVVEGESLGGLAERYHVSLADLRAWNELSGDRILVGQRLCVHQPEPVATSESDPDDTERQQPDTSEDSGEPSAHTGAAENATGAEAPEDADHGRTHHAIAGDTLGCVARRNGLTLASLFEANPTLRGHALEIGAEIRIVGGWDPSRTRTRSHRIARGDTLGRVARRAGLSLSTLMHVNPSLEPDHIQVGQRVALPLVGSQSLGAPNCGSMIDGVQLGNHRGYVLRNPERAWATEATISELRGAFDVVRRRHRRAARVRVHDLSLEGGGAIDDHRSHQSGRDVDITYYQRSGCESEGCPLERIDRSELDVRRQWTLLRHWLRRESVEAIYIDYHLQAPLYREARRRGASARQLRQWFQYPNGRWHAEGRVRHFPHHRDHLHVRFSCRPGEALCR